MDVSAKAVTAREATAVCRVRFPAGVAQQLRASGLRSAKGGIVVAVQRQLGIPVKLVGLGEGVDDLAPFDPEGFVDALLG